MNDSSLEQSRLSTFELRVAERFFPDSAKREVQQAEELSIDFRALLNDLNDRFHGNVRMGVESEHVKTFSDLIPLYQAGVTKIGNLQTDWYQFIESLVHFEVDESVSHAASVILKKEHDKEKQNWLNQVWNDAELRREQIVPIIEARMSSSPVEEVRIRLTEDLDAKCSRLGLEIVSSLCRLVDLQVCGLVEWHGPNHCKYHYYSRILKTSTESELRSTLLKVNTATDNQWVEKTVTSGKHMKSLCRFVHHLTNAVRHVPGNATLPIPADRRKIIEAIPSWLLPDVRIVEGTLFRSTTITQDLASSDWKNEQIDRVVFMRDPALTLGPFVLTGWGPKDIQREITRRGGSDLALAGVDALAVEGDLQSSIDHRATDDTLLLLACGATVAGTLMIYVGWAGGFSGAFAVPGYMGLGVSAWLFGVLAKQQAEQNSPVPLLETQLSSEAMNTTLFSIPPHAGSAMAVGLFGAATTAFSQGNYITFVLLALLCAFAGTDFYRRHLSNLWKPPTTAPLRK